MKAPRLYAAAQSAIYRKVFVLCKDRIKLQTVSVKITRIKLAANGDEFKTGPRVQTYSNLQRRVYRTVSCVCILLQCLYIRTESDSSGTSIHVASIVLVFVFFAMFVPSF